MKLQRSVKVYNKHCDIIISDDDVALREARASLKATIAILGDKDLEMGLSKYAVSKIEDIDSRYLKTVACRHLKLPVIIGKIGKIHIREMRVQDWEVLCKFQDFPFKTQKEFNEYIPLHYDLFGYGLYVAEKEEIIALAGFYNENSKCFISYTVAPCFRNQGYGFLICKYLLKYLKESEGIDRVYVRIKDENIPSIKLSKKLGITRIT